MAKFYDIESGRNTVDNRSVGDAHEQFDIPIPCDGGIAELLADLVREEHATAP